eukprot:811419-Amphidinium_carterae.1
MVLGPYELMLLRRVVCVPIKLMTTPRSVICLYGYFIAATGKPSSLKIPMRMIDPQLQQHKRCTKGSTQHTSVSNQLPGASGQFSGTSSVLQTNLPLLWSGKKLLLVVSLLLLVVGGGVSFWQSWNRSHNEDPCSNRAYLWSVKPNTRVRLACKRRDSRCRASRQVPHKKTEVNLVLLLSKRDVQMFN